MAPSSVEDEEIAAEAKLIKLVKKYPALYNSKFGRVNEKKSPMEFSAIWEMISKKTKFSADDCYDKWLLLRKQYARSKPDTSWPHYESLKFLEPFIRRRKKEMRKNQTAVKRSGSEDIMSDRKRKRDAEEESVKAFCLSLGSDLLRLPHAELMSCKIKLLVTVRKCTKKSSERGTLLPKLEDQSETIVIEDSDDDVRNESSSHEFASEPINITTLEKMILSGGVDEDNFCNFCQTHANEDHIYSDAHEDAASKYFLRCSLLHLDPGIFEFTHSPRNLQCSICCEHDLPYDLPSWWSTREHIREFEGTHYSSSQSAAVSPYTELFKTIRHGVLKLKNNTLFCLLCNEYVNSISSHKKWAMHQENQTNMRAFCLLRKRVFCFCCKKVFNIAKLEKHIAKNSHRSKFYEYLANCE